MDSDKKKEVTVQLDEEAYKIYQQFSEAEKENVISYALKLWHNHQTVKEVYYEKLSELEALMSERLNELIKETNTLIGEESGESSYISSTLAKMHERTSGDKEDRAKLGVYLSKVHYKQSKREAIEWGVSLSDFLKEIVTTFIQEVQRQKLDFVKEIKSLHRESKENTLAHEQIIVVYLDEEQRKAIRKFAVRNHVSLSSLFNYALFYYFDPIMQSFFKGLDLEEKFSISRPPETGELKRTEAFSVKSVESIVAPETKKSQKSRRKILTYYISPRIKEWLSYYCVEKDKTQTEIIFEAVQKVTSDHPTEDILAVELPEHDKTKSSMALEESRIKYLKDEASKLGVSVTELINKALYMYLTSSEV